MDNSLLNYIGNTPLVELKNIEEKYKLKSKLFAKLEMFNLSGSIKIRIAKEIILDGVELNKEALVAENIYWAETEYRSNINVKAISKHKSISTTRPIKDN